MNAYERFIWASGLFEGEGSISVRQSRAHGKHYKYLSLQLSNTDKDTMQKFYCIVKVGALCGGRRGYVLKGKRKRVWKWAVSGHKAETLCKRLLPFLGLRRNQRAHEVFREVHQWSMR